MLWPTELPAVKNGGPPSIRLPAVDHPRDTEAVHRHTETFRPERRSKWHHHLSLFRQGLEDFLAFGGSLKGDVHIETLWLHIARRRSVHAHQYLVAHGHPGMHNLPLPFRAHLFRGGRALMRKTCIDFSSQAFLGELKRLLALTTEVKIRIQLHN